jgi:hypothetical protein
MNAQELSKKLLFMCSEMEKIAKAVASMETSNAVFPDARLDAIEKRICLVCGDPIPEVEVPSRGCHRACYRQVNRRIKSGEFTDAEAITAGVLYYKLPGGRKEDAKNAAITETVQGARLPPAKTAKAQKKS